ncbi:MAG: hypothetical protein FIA99_08885 [Ruminiclostridium sp.]|nr:hypothetical protein [Ruminiclostridium sp.]
MLLLFFYKIILVISPCLYGILKKDYNIYWRKLMKIAIIGAGIAGLSCANELNRLGFPSVIFEKTHMLGDKPGNLTAILRLFQKGFRNPMEYILNRCGMNISPLHPIKEMVVNTPNKILVSRANHGYVFIKGIAENSLEHQLASHSKMKILFDNEIDIKTIKSEFEHIVVATGSGDFARGLGIWNNTFASAVRIAVISGNFQVNTMTLWLNKNYSRNGFVYMLPKNPTEAELVMAVSDINKNDLDFYWKTFIKGEKLDYKILEIHDMNHCIGYPNAIRLENIYFVGNSGGMIDNFLGFGITRAIDSGILAARAIAQNLDFSKLMQPFIKDVKRLDEYRKMLNVLTNKDFDTDISILRLPVIKHLVYNNPLYKASFGLLAPKIIYTYKTYKNNLSLKFKK